MKVQFTTKPLIRSFETRIVSFLGWAGKESLDGLLRYHKVKDRQKDDFLKAFNTLKKLGIIVRKDQKYDLSRDYFEKWKTRSITERMSRLEEAVRIKIGTISKEECMELDLKKFEWEIIKH